MVETQRFFVYQGQFAIQRWITLGDTAIGELIAQFKLLLNLLRAELQSLLEHVYVQLLLFKEGFGSHDSSIAATKDKELAVTVSHVSDDLVTIFAALACRVQLKQASI